MQFSDINDLWETSLQTDRGLFTNCAPVTTTGKKVDGNRYLPFPLINDYHYSQRPKSV